MFETTNNCISRAQDVGYNLWTKPEKHSINSPRGIMVSYKIKKNLLPINGKRLIVTSDDNMNEDRFQSQDEKGNKFLYEDYNFCKYGF